MYGIVFACMKDFTTQWNTYCIQSFFLFVSLFLNISQVEKNIPGAYILACAPSNSAADQLCEKLIASQHVDARKIFRLYASSRDPKDIPKVIKVSVCFRDRPIYRFTDIFPDI